MAFGGARGSWALALAIAGAVLLLAAIEASTAPGAGGLRTSRDTVRLLVSGVVVAAGVVSWRSDARTEAIGFFVAAGCLAASAGADALGTRWIVAGADAAARLRRAALFDVVAPVVVLGVPAAAGALALRIPPGRVFSARRPASRVVLGAALLGLLSFPVLNAANVFGNAALREAMASGTGTVPRFWPPFTAVLDRPFFPLSADTRFVSLAARLGLFLPLLEACLHGVLRQAFLRWGAKPFVVGTAFLAPLLALDLEMTFGLFGGSIVTGFFAARTASVLPGLAFWCGLFVGQTLSLSL